MIMIPKFGNITNPMNDILKEIKTVKKMKFDFVEIGIEGPGATPEIVLKNNIRILKSLEGFNANPVVHTSWWIELGSEYDLIRTGWVEEGKKIIELANMLNSRVVNFHANAKGMYFRSESGKKTILKNMARSLKELGKFARQFGIKIMLENMPPGDGVSDVEDYNYLMKEVRSLNLHLDIGHAFINRGIDHIENYVTKFKGRLLHIHVSDNHGKQDEHLPLGTASINYQHIVKILKEIGYDKTVTFEVFTANRNLAKRSMDYFKKLWKKI